MGKHLFRFIGNKESEDRWIIRDEEHFHLKKILRLKEGDVAEVTDGCGRWGRGVLVVVSSKEAVLEVSEEFLTEPPKQSLTIGIGALKHGMIDKLLFSLVESGVDQIDVYYQKETEKSRIDAKSQMRWNKIIKEAVKQCKRTWVPKLEVFPSLGAMLTHWDKKDPESNRVFLDDDTPYSLLDYPLDDGPIYAIIGGEKGLSNDEIASLRSFSFSSANVGENVLRSYTAAIVASSILSIRRCR